MKLRLLPPAVVMAAAVLLLPGAGGAPQVHTIVIDKLAFSPGPVGLHAGDTILWVNHDIFQHSATARDGSFNVDLLPGKSGKIVLKEPGTIAFYCRYHPGMKGVLTVSR